MNWARLCAWAVLVVLPGCSLLAATGPLPEGMGGAGGEPSTGGRKPSGSGGDSSPGGQGGDASTGGKSSADGGKGTGDGGSEPSGGSPGAGGNGSGGGSVDSPIDHLIDALCAHEFDCCNEGEIAYRLGSAGNSAADCAEFFKYQLHYSNSTTNPFVSGPGTTGLGLLGYRVDLTRVTEDPEGIAACVAAVQALECPQARSGPPAFCEGPVFPNADICALQNLFKPALKKGDVCTPLLGEGQGNDVECPIGTTCVVPGKPGNETGSSPVCITKAVADQPCATNEDCDFELYCDQDGKCAPKGGAGERCSFRDPNAPKPGEEVASCRGGLRCSPTIAACVANCSEGYPCQTNAECPQGMACAPALVGTDVTTWKTCQPLGQGTTALCDEHADCAPEFYCEGVCTPDQKVNEACKVDAHCEPGTYCSSMATGTAGYLTCQPWIQPEGACDAALGTRGGCSDAAPFCLLNPITNKQICETKLRGPSEPCNPLAAGLPNGPQGGDCNLGLRCEVTDGSAPSPYVCTPGAPEGEYCDTALEDDRFLACEVGLVCRGSVCLRQAGPGENCEDPNLPGSGDDVLCENFRCVDNWDDGGSAFVCSDAATPEFNGGDGVTCGG